MIPPSRRDKIIIYKVRSKSNHRFCRNGSSCLSSESQLRIRARLLEDKVPDTLDASKEHSINAW